MSKKRAASSAVCNAASNSAKRAKLAVPIVVELVCIDGKIALDLEEFKGEVEARGACVPSVLAIMLGLTDGGFKQKKTHTGRGLRVFRFPKEYGVSVEKMAKFLIFLRCGTIKGEAFQLERLMMTINRIGGSDELCKLYRTTVEKRQARMDAADEKKRLHDLNPQTPADDYHQRFDWIIVSMINARPTGWSVCDNVPDMRQYYYARKEKGGNNSVATAYH